MIIILLKTKTMNKDNHNDFENKGWEAMLQTLDREMPIEKKRRPFLWLVFLFGLIAIGISRSRVCNMASQPLFSKSLWLSLFIVFYLQF